MDFTKFVSFIAGRSLFFCRSDRLGDPFEGSYPKKNIEMRPLWYGFSEKDLADGPFKVMSEVTRWIRYWTYVSCWHRSEHESAAMWRLYSKSDEAIAVQATYDRLVRVLPEKAFVGLVAYVDYETEFIPEGNTFYPFLCKRKSFEHEREVRAVIQDLPETKGDKLGIENADLGMNMEVDVDDLVENVYVAPTSPLWYRDLVQEVMERYDIVRPVIRSSLDDQPVY
jgi:hypothetical protein